MHTHKRSLDTNKNLLVERYKQGIRLVKPESDAAGAHCSVATLFDLPIPAYFYDTESNFIDVNENCALLVAAESAADMQGTSPARFCSREFSEKIFAIDDAVIRNESMSMVEEVGFRSDDFLIQCMSLKLPWYDEDRVVGLLGFSIYTDNHSLSEFSGRMSSLLATGLMDSASPLRAAVMPRVQLDNIYLSNREIEVLSHLVRGRTAKEISEHLGISRRTVEHHIEHIKEKSRCRTRSELVDKFYDDLK